MILIAACSRGGDPATGPTLEGGATSATAPPASSLPSTPPVSDDARHALLAELFGADAGSPASSAHDGDGGAVPTLAIDPFPGKLVTAGKSIGHTSVAFKLTFAGGARAAFKPASHRGGARYRGEVAAYALGVALGLPNVPPAFDHDFVAKDLASALDPPAQALFAQEAIVSDAGIVKGALIPWVEDLEFPPVERDPLHARWAQALKVTSPLPTGDDAELAAQMSTLIVFDILDGNWDRWSGGNVGQVGRTYLYIDNDGAFFATPPEKAMARGWQRLDEVDRFSRSFVGRLRAFDEAAGASADVLAATGLPAAALKGFRERRTKVLSVIDAKIATYGEAKVFAFP